MLDACRAACWQLYGLSVTGWSPTRTQPRKAGRLSPVTDLTQLAESIRKFNADRDWDKFHDPKSLMLALVGEVGELAELLQWVPANEATTLAREEPLRSRLGEEISDVLIYLLQLAEVCSVDIVSAATSKLVAAERKFPRAEFLGRAPHRE
jgi:dCTP diphosphatase